MQQINNSTVGRGPCETGGYLMWKLWVSLFVYFQFQAAGFPAQRPGFDMGYDKPLEHFSLHI